MAEAVVGSRVVNSISTIRFNIIHAQRCGIARTRDVSECSLLKTNSHAHPANICRERANYDTSLEAEGIPDPGNQYSMISRPTGSVEAGRARDARL